MSVQIHAPFYGPTTTTTTTRTPISFTASTTNNKMSTAARSSRLPLQPRNPNTYAPSSLASSDSKTTQLSALESSNNENNKARFLSASLRKSSSSSLMTTSDGYPVEIGSEQDSSLVTHTGAAALVGSSGGGGNPKAMKRQASGNSIGSRNSVSDSQAPAPAAPVRQHQPRVPSVHLSNNNNSAGNRYANEPSSDQDQVIEEKRKRIHGDGYTMHRYLRGRLLGKGGFAKVYLCTALDTNKQYAVKVVPKANLVKTRARQKVRYLLLLLILFCFRYLLRTTCCQCEPPSSHTLLPFAPLPFPVASGD
jgi:hypothetical protein